eukprot:tig00000189_g14305.t1
MFRQLFPQCTKETCTVALCATRTGQDEEAIAAELTSKRRKFEDPSFPATMAALYRNGASPFADAPWNRPRQLERPQPVQRARPQPAQRPRPQPAQRPRPQPAQRPPELLAPLVRQGQQEQRQRVRPQPVQRAQLQPAPPVRQGPQEQPVQRARPQPVQRARPQPAQRPPELLAPLVRQGQQEQRQRVRPQPVQRARPQPAPPVRQGPQEQLEQLPQPALRARLVQPVPRARRQQGPPARRARPAQRARPARRARLEQPARQAQPQPLALPPVQQGPLEQRARLRRQARPGRQARRRQQPRRPRRRRRRRRRGPTPTPSQAQLFRPALTFPLCPDPPRAGSVDGDFVEKHCIWLRPKEFCPGRPQLFIDGSNPGDVIQGMLSNEIWLPALLGCIWVDLGTLGLGLIDNGVVKNHAYGVLEAREVEEGARRHRLVRVRNPWGRQEWSGRFADGSPDWTPALLEKLRHSFADDGTFWILWQDFVQTFNCLYACEIFADGWKGQSVTGAWKKGVSAFGPPPDSAWERNRQFHLKVTGRTRLEISLSQGDVRPLGLDELHFPAGVGVAIVKAKGSAPGRPLRSIDAPSIVFQSPCLYSRDVSASAVLEAGDYKVGPGGFEPEAPLRAPPFRTLSRCPPYTYPQIVPMTAKPDQEAIYSLSVWSDRDVDLEGEKAIQELDKEEVTAAGEGAGADFAAPPAPSVYPPTRPPPENPKNAAAVAMEVLDALSAATQRLAAENSALKRRHQQLHLPPVRILNHIEKTAKKPIPELFDFIAGTSAGAIAAMALSARGKDGKLARNTDAAIRSTYEWGGRIFPHSTNGFVRFFRNFRTASVFSTWKARESKEEDHLLYDVGKATSAAPAFLPAHEVDVPPA